LNFETNDELIGGVVTRIGSTVFDGSVRNQLDQLKEQLIGKA
jgi:F-type H+-transporting ATPase subunit delta